jgi:hypothetical protein
MTMNTENVVKAKRGRKPGQAVKCSYCGELGHMAKTCPKNPNRSAKAEKKSLHKALVTDSELELEDSNKEAALVTADNSEALREILAVANGRF